MKTYNYESNVYPDVVFNNIDFGLAKGMLSFDKLRVSIRGKLSINKVKSDKFGEEIQLQIYSASVIKEVRNDSSWNRLELFFPIEQIDDLIKSLEKIKQEGKK